MKIQCEYARDRPCKAPASRFYRMPPGSWVTRCVHHDLALTREIARLSDVKRFTKEEYIVAEVMES